MTTEHDRIKALTTERDALIARIADLETVLRWVIEETETVDRSDHHALAIAVIKCEDFARIGLAERTSA